jgi:gliding motility-associated-like protein
MKKFLLLLCILMLYSLAHATHQRAGEITYKAISQLQYEFKIVTYTYTPSPADRPQLNIDWGDGTSQTVLRTSKVDLPNNISRNEYAGIIHTFPGQGSYIVSVEDPNRNYGVLNIPNSVNVPFFIRTQLVINPFLGPNTSVELLAPPIDIGCVNELYLHNPVAYDVDGDSLSYKLVPCRGSFGLPIPGYILPNEVGENNNTTFDIDPVTGTITWSKPVLQGEYNIAFLIEEWRSGVRIGYVTRDMQITILACSNQSPQINPIQDTCIKAGDTLSFAVSATDPDGDQVIISALGDPFRAASSPAVFPTAIGDSIVGSSFTWNTNCTHARKQPYQVVFTAKDTFNFPQLSDIQTMNIRVISPPPKNLSASPVGNAIHLSWNKAECSQSTGYRLYRRSGFLGFVPGACETGVPGYTGYQQIAEIETIADTTFIDNNSGQGLAPGTVYCYMVISYLADGAESYASEEVCASLKKDTPVITNVSIEETSGDNGKIFVGWSKPNEHDTILFPPPYKYVINRAESFATDFVEVGETNGINDTLFMDDANLNTLQNTYAYKIDMYSLSTGIDVLMGSSRVANSMFLSIAPTDRAAELTWTVNVPWQNSQYEIFRYNEQSENFEPVGVSTVAAYLDEGLENGTAYNYYVKSTGRYSAAGMVDPIINFSQIASVTPIDNLPPCPPILSVSTNCELIQNELSWINPTGCPEDIAGYNVFYTPTLDGEPELIAMIEDALETNFVHTPNATIAGCYLVTAVDSIGNESDFSNKVCVNADTCANYRLPNVFTPNRDGFNELFVPFPDYTSVEKINLQIFNRWGGVVFETEDPEINWDGKNMNTNRDCPEGVYFYVCDVFEIGLEGLTKRTITGSVTILR